MTKPADTSASQSDILSQLALDDALAVLRILVDDETMAAHVREVAVAYVEDSTPRGPEDVATIAADL